MRRRDKAGLKATRRHTTRREKSRRSRNSSKTRDLTEAREQQAATSAVLKVISTSAFELQTVFGTLVELATRLCHANASALWRLASDEMYHLAASCGLAPDFQSRLQSLALRADGRSVVGRCLQTGKTVYVPDLVRDQEYAKRQATDFGGYRGLLCVPLQREDLSVGVLMVAHKTIRKFTPQQIALVENFASQAVIAIENTRLLNELRESLQQQTATADVLKVISRSTFDLKSVLNTLIEAAARLCDADNGTIALPKEKDVYQNVASYRQSAALEAELTRTGLKVGKGSLIGRTALNRATVHILDVQKDPDYELHAALKIGDYHTMLGIPLLREGNLIGVLGLARQTIRPFTEKQIELVTTFADQAVIAVENARLFEEVKKRTEELAESLEQQTATSEVLKVISSSPGELQPVFEAMLANAARICEAELGHLFLCEGTIFRAVAISKESSHVDLRSNPVLDVRDNPGTPIDLLFKTKQVVHIPDLQSHQSYIGRNNRIVPLVEVGGARTFATVPMLKEGEIIGAISMYRQEVRPFTDKQIELVKNFAAQAVIAIENTRLLSELRESLQQQTAPQTCSRSSAVRLSIYRRCSTRW